MREWVKIKFDQISNKNNSEEILKHYKYNGMKFFVLMKWITMKLSLSSGCSIQLALFDEIQYSANRNYNKYRQLKKNN